VGIHVVEVLGCESRVARQYGDTKLCTRATQLAHWRGICAFAVFAA